MKPPNYFKQIVERDYSSETSEESEEKSMREFDAQFEEGFIPSDEERIE